MIPDVPSSHLPGVLSRVRLASIAPILISMINRRGKLELYVQAIKNEIILMRETPEAIYNARRSLVFRLILNFLIRRL